MLGHVVFRYITALQHGLDLMYFLSQQNKKVEPLYPEINTQLRWNK